MKEIEFYNETSTDITILTVGTLEQAEKVILWYYSFCAGDNIITHVDEIWVHPDPNGYVKLVSEIA